MKYTSHNRVNGSGFKFGSVFLLMAKASWLIHEVILFRKTGFQSKKNPINRRVHNGIFFLHYKLKKKTLKTKRIMKRILKIWQVRPEPIIS